MTSELSTVSVLCVDDDPDLVDLTATFLEQTTDLFSVTTTTSAHDALEILETTTHDIDCIVSDYDMPGMNGITFLEIVRADHPDLPFILFTGRGSEEVASDAISAGVTDYMQKETGTDQYAVLSQRIQLAVERYHARQQAQAEQQRARTILESSPDAIMVGSTDGLEYVNPAAVDLFEANNPAHLRETPIRDLLHPDDQDMIAENFEPIRCGDTTLTRTRRTFQTLDGRSFPGDITARHITWDDTDCVIAIIRDVSELEAKERELKETVLQLEGVLDSIQAAVWLKDIDGRYLVVNQQWRKLLDIDTEEVAGRTGEELFDKPIAEQFATNDRQAITRNEQIELEEEVPTAHGTRTYLTRITPVYDEDGTVYATCGIATDITDQKERERELEHHHDRFNVLFETLPEPTVHLTEEKAATILDVNPAFEDVFGYEAETVRGENLNDFIVPPDKREEARQIDSQGYEGELFTREVQRQTADGELRDFLLIATGQRPEIDEAFAIYVDITARRESERQLQRQNERLSKFVSIVSHDLRNPLTIAEGNVELAHEDCESAHLETALEALDRMGNLIEDLLTLARQGEQATELESIAIDEIANSCWRTVETNGASLVVETEQTIRAEKSRLRQLLENLIHNAVEHGGEEVTVTIGELGDGFYVADDGAGIPADDRTDIFERGYTTNDTGTGFGLAIVTEIVEAHGWEIAIAESESGGARFEITGVEFVE